MSDRYWTDPESDWREMRHRRAEAAEAELPLLMQKLADKLRKEEKEREAVK